MKSLRAFALLLMGATLALSSCPDIEDYDVLYNSDTFLCGHGWQGEGNSDPNLGCAASCIDGSRYGFSLPQDYYLDAGDGYNFPMGSLYVMPGCHFYGYSDSNYEGSVSQYDGPYEGYKLPDPPLSSSGCPNGFASYKCLCDQTMIDCVPSDTYANVLLCDNTGGVVETTCTYSQQVGTAYSSTAESSMSVSSSVEKAIQAGLGNIFGTDIGTSTTTGYDWTISDTTTYERVVTNTVESTAPPGYVLHIDQVVGVCEDNITRPNYFKTYHTTKDGKLVEGSVKYFSNESIKGSPLRSLPNLKKEEGEQLADMASLRDNINA